MAGVFVVDGNRLFREGLKRILSGQGFEVLGEAHSFAAASRSLEREGSSAHLLLGDPAPNLAQEFEAITSIGRHSPDLKIVILTERRVSQWPERALNSGALGFLSQDISAEALKHALNLVLTGERIIPTAIPSAPSAFPTHSDADNAAAPILAKPLRRADLAYDSAPLAALPAKAIGSTSPHQEAAEAAPEALATLSSREREILNCLLRGLPNKLIARELAMAEATVKVHLRALLRKLKARNRTQAAIWAIESRSATFAAANSENLSIAQTMPAARSNAQPSPAALLDRQQVPFSGWGASLTVPEYAILTGWEILRSSAANGVDVASLKTDVQSVVG